MLATLPGFCAADLGAGGAPRHNDELAVRERSLRRWPLSEREQRRPNRAGVGDDQRRRQTGRNDAQRCTRAPHLFGERLATGECELRVGRLKRRVQIGLGRRDVLQRLALPVTAV